MKPKTLETVYVRLFIYGTVWTLVAFKLIFVDGNGAVLCAILRICPQRDQVCVSLSLMYPTAGNLEFFYFWGNYGLWMIHMGTRVFEQ